MIQSFVSKELQKFFEKGDSSKINPGHKKKIRRLLLWLNNIQTIEDVGFPNFGLHRLKGNRKGYYAIKVSGNYRLIFRFENGNVQDLDYEDYH